MYAEVIVDIAADSVDRVFTYRVPDEFHKTVQKGTRVRVPFGFREKEGVVLNLKENAGYDENKIKNIFAPLEEYPAILPALIDLAGEISQKTHCSLAQALRFMLPSQMRGGRVKIKTSPYVKLNFDPSLAQEAIEKQGRAANRKLILSILSDGEEHPLEEIRAMVHHYAAPLRYLVEHELVLQFEKEVLRTPTELRDSPENPNYSLTEEQKEVLGELLPALNQKNQAFLLHGVTGSGKTEVFIRFTKEILSRKKTVILLVPEIALTPQMISFFRTRFGEDMAVLHSRLSPGERYDEWRRIRLGSARIVIGARSAVFAPVQDLGAIIIDEEHEQSYVSDRYPQYDARKIAQSRIMREGGVLLLASATPSLLSYAKARRGDYTLLEMPRRVFNRPMPNVEIVDMREELRKGNRSIFSGKLVSQLNHCLSEGQQAILFLNRRGYAPFVNCRKCGAVLKCDQCDVSLTYHATDGRLHCHYCGKNFAFPEKCPSCGSNYLKQCGVGTQKVEEEIKKIFPDVSVIRMDLDTTTSKNAHLELLSRFRARQAQILIGTQMIVKGLDFPNVTLVCAVLADMTLHLPDYRASERTYQLLVQAAGRAGRGEKPGTVLIQSYTPEHYAVCAAAKQDFRSYFNEEMARRKQNLYPPFTKMVRILFEGLQPDATLEEAKKTENAVHAFLKENLPFKKRLLFIRSDYAPITRIHNKTRAQVLLKLLDHPETDTIINELQHLTERVEEKAGETGIHALLEIDPASLA